jgi:DNA-binding response OmpR family regulator
MILDIILPRESGEVFFTRLKKINAYKSLKVLCVTVLGDVSDYFQKIDPKTECMPKPLDKQKLLNKIKEMMG